MTPKHPNNRDGPACPNPNRQRWDNNVSFKSSSSSIGKRHILKNIQYVSRSLHVSEIFEKARSCVYPSSVRVRGETLTGPTQFLKAWQKLLICIMSCLFDEYKPNIQMPISSDLLGEKCWAIKSAMLTSWLHNVQFVLFAAGQATADLSLYYNFIAYIWNWQDWTKTVKLRVKTGSIADIKLFIIRWPDQLFAQVQRKTRPRRLWLHIKLQVLLLRNDTSGCG